jgi:hypothetical protein
VRLRDPIGPVDGRRVGQQHVLGDSSRGLDRLQLHPHMVPVGR